GNERKSYSKRKTVRGGCGANAYKVKQRGDDLGHGWLANPAETQTGQGHTELSRGQRGIKVVNDFAGDAGQRAATPGKIFNICAAYLYQGKLGRDEEGIRQDQPKCK